MSPGDQTLYGLGAAATAGVAKYAVENPPPFDPDRPPPQEMAPSLLRRGIGAALDWGEDAYDRWQAGEGMEPAERPFESPEQVGQWGKAAGKLLGVETATGVPQLAAMAGTPMQMGLHGQGFGDAYTETLTGLPMGEEINTALEQARQEYREAGGTAFGEFALGAAAPFGPQEFAAVGGLAFPMIRGGAKRKAMRPGGVGPSARQIADVVDTQPVRQPAGVAKQRSVGGLDFRSASSLEDAQIMAREGMHLKRAKGTRGQYVGAPHGITTPGKLKKMRSALDKKVEEGLQGADWYKRAQDFVTETTRGMTPEMQRRWIRGLGKTSEQADPDVNLGFALRGHLGGAWGLQPKKIKTGRQARWFDSLWAGQDPALGPKTDVFSGWVDPNRAPQYTGTNDIWHGRAFGYTELDSKTGKRVPWASGFSDSQHAFLDAETVLAVERANARKLGGHRDWDAGMLQAAIWVAEKAHADEMVGKGLRTWDDAIALAARTYPDWQPKHTAYMVHENIPYAGSGHLSPMTEAPRVEREAYSEATGWLGPDEEHVALAGMGVPQGPHIRGQGTYTDPMTGQFEAQPLPVSTPMIGLRKDTPPAGTKVLYNEPDPEHMGRLQELGYIHGALGVQGGSPAHMSMPTTVGTSGARPASANALLLQHAETPSPAEAGALTQIGEEVGFGGESGFFANRGQTSVMAGWDAPGTKELTRIGEDVAQRAEAAGIPVPKISRGRVDSVYPSLEAEWMAGEGSGQVVRKLFDNVTDDTIARWDANPANRKRTLNWLDTDEGVRIIHPDWPFRQDVQLMRTIVHDSGLAGLKAAMKQGMVLPAVGLPVLLFGLSSEEGGAL
jgi:hypothetical protein